VRSEWGLEEGDEVVTLIARLVAIKRVDRFLRVATLLAQRPRVRFVIVGDGALRTQLAASTEARALGDRLLWTGFRRDIADVCFGSDVVVLTSDNEGTPVSLIEAQAAAVPVVGTAVGGVRSAVRDGETGLVADAGDDQRLAAAIAAILDDDALAARMGRAGREYATRSFAVERLVDDIDRLYSCLLSRQATHWRAPPTCSSGSSPGSQASVD
jgi:glycosyltransferase involved in cell wall biosynthesis